MQLWQALRKTPSEQVFLLLLTSSPFLRVGRNQPPFVCTVQLQNRWEHELQQAAPAAGKQGWERCSSYSVSLSFAHEAVNN